MAVCICCGLCCTGAEAGGPLLPTAEHSGGDALLRGPCSEMSHGEGTRAAALRAKGLSGVTTWRPTKAYKSRQAARRRAGSSVAGGRK